MKVLIVNLLRIGDVIMGLPVADGLRRRYAGAQIDLLINAEASGLLPLIRGFDKVHLFERSLIQESLRERDRNIFEGYDRIERLLSSITSEQYDLCINLSSTRISAWLMGLIDAKNKVGFCLRAGENASFGSPWFQWLNDHGLDEHYDGFHYIDIWSHGSGGSGRRRLFTVLETEDGRRKAETETLAFDSFICVQALTSDPKKSWGMGSFAQALKLYSEGDRPLPFVLLGAPSEKPELDQLSKLLQENRVRHKVVCCDFETAFSILKRSSALLTCDTSIKHLAAAAGVRTLEISLGSSNFWKTGVYLDRCLILQSLEACAPCPHKNPCPKPSHLCGERIPPEVVALSLQTLLNWDERNIRAIAEEFEADVAIYVTEFSDEGEWHAIPLTPEREKDVIKRWLRRSAEKIALNQSNQNLASYGSEGVHLNRILAHVFPEKEKWHWIEVLKSFEHGQTRMEDQIKNLDSQLKISLRSLNEDDVLDELIRRVDQALSVTKESLDLPDVRSDLDRLKAEIAKSESGFTALKRGREVIGRIQRRMEIETRLIKALKTQILENL